MAETELALQKIKNRTYVIVWLCLLALTALTVAVARLHWTGYAVLSALAIATLKAGLVVSFFMHLKEEPWVLKVLFCFVLFVLAVTIMLTFSDVLFRKG